jgi:hypothetical protein
MLEMVELLEREVERRIGKSATFEQRQDARAALMAEALAKAMEEDQAEGPKEVPHVRQRSVSTSGPQ